MTLPDVNVLVCTFRTDSQYHAECRRWLGSTINGDAAFGMSPEAMGSVVRVPTNRRMFKRPDPLDKVLAYTNAVPLGNLRRLCREVEAAGGLLPDAWFAAPAMFRRTALAHAVLRRGTAALPVGSPRGG